jgi:pilus assembly protein CpaF
MSFEIIIPFLKPIEHLLASKTVSEIMVNPDGSVWMEEKGHIELQPGVRFEDGALLTGLEVIANRFGKKLDADSPIMNLRLPDGSRMAALIPPVVNPQPMMTIRKFTSREFTMQDLIDLRMLSPEQAQQLANAVRRGDNLLISGGTGAGKTTLTNVIAGFIPDSDRILILEDVAELYIRK